MSPASAFFLILDMRFQPVCAQKQGNMAKQNAYFTNHAPDTLNEIR